MDQWFMGKMESGRKKNCIKFNKGVGKKFIKFSRKIFLARNRSKLCIQNKIYRSDDGKKIYKFSMLWEKIV